MYFTEGANAYKKGIKYSECPYPEDSYAGSEWHSGWSQQSHLSRCSHSNTELKSLISQLEQIVREIKSLV